MIYFYLTNWQETHTLTPYALVQVMGITWVTQPSWTSGRRQGLEALIGRIRIAHQRGRCPSVRPSNRVDFPGSLRCWFCHCYVVFVPLCFVSCLDVDFLLFLLKCTRTLFFFYLWPMTISKTKRGLTRTSGPMLYFITFEPWIDWHFALSVAPPPLICVPLFFLNVAMYWRQIYCLNLESCIYI